MEQLLEKYPPMMTTAQIAEILGVSVETVRKLVKRKQLVGIRVGKNYKYPKDKLIDFLNG